MVFFPKILLHKIFVIETTKFDKPVNSFVTKNEHDYEPQSGFKHFNAKKAANKIRDQLNMLIKCLWCRNLMSYAFANTFCGSYIRCCSNYMQIHGKPLNSI